jgi:hypothetical protein
VPHHQEVGVQRHEVRQREHEEADPAGLPQVDPPPLGPRLARRHQPPRHHPGDQRQQRHRRELARHQRPHAGAGQPGGDAHGRRHRGGADVGTGERAKLHVLLEQRERRDPGGVQDDAQAQDADRVRVPAIGKRGGDRAGQGGDRRRRKQPGTDVQRDRAAHLRAPEPRRGDDAAARAGVDQ